MTALAAQQSFKPTVFERLFIVLLVYYWALQFTKGDQVELIPFSVGYYLFVVPAAAFGVLATIYMLATVQRLNKPAWMLAAFVVLVVLISLYRSDLRTIASVGLLGATLMALFQTVPRVPLTLINVLFLLAIPLNAILYYFDYSIYTFIPGIGSSPLWWRISAFPSVAEGGLFAMVVFVMNLAIRGHRTRPLMLVVSAYMCLLSGSRTGLVAVLFAILYMALRSRGLLARKRGRNLFFTAVIALFVMSIFASDILLALPFADSEFLRTVIFREEALGRFDVGSQLGTAAVRQWIFEQHLAAFRDSPLIGIGTFDFRMLTTGYEALDNSATGSEAFVTGLLARIGLLSVLLFSALLMTSPRLDQQSIDLATCCRIGLFVGMVTYGSFVNVYDILFLILIVGIAGGIVPETSNAPARASPSGQAAIP